MKLFKWPFKKKSKFPQRNPQFVSVPPSGSNVSRIVAGYNFKRGNNPHVRQTSIKQMRQEKTLSAVRNTAEMVKKYVRYGFFLIGGLLLLAALGVGAYVLHQEQVFVLKEIEIIGNKEISTLQLASFLEKYKSSSLFQISTDGLEADLRQEFPYIKAVYVKKVLPSRLQVDIQERFPVMAYVNRTGAYLVDDDQVVVETMEVNYQGLFKSEEVQVLNDQADPDAVFVYDRYIDSLATQQERDRVIWSLVDIKDKQEILANMKADLQLKLQMHNLVVEGYGDPNAEYVLDRYKESLATPEERSEVKWEEVPGEVKIATLADLRNFLSSQIEAELVVAKTLLQDSKFNAIKRVEAYDLRIYKIGDSLTGQKIDASTDVFDYLTAETIFPARLLWRSDFTLVAELVNGISILFTTTKPMDSQLQALDTIRMKTDLDGVSVIDLRSELVSIR